MNLTTIENFLTAFGLLAMALGVLISVLYWWKKSLRSEEMGDNPLELLSHFTAARDAGEMDEQEYQRVREVMIRRAREEGLVPMAGESKSSLKPSESPAPSESSKAVDRGGDLADFA